MQRWWSGALVRCFGFRIRRVGEPLPGAVMFVANHVSWLDIELMHSQRVMAFVAKEEISRWPLVGWLATRAGTIYHRRGSTHSLGAVQEQMVDRLRSGMAVGMFPEGGTRTRRSRAHVSRADFPGGRRYERADPAGRVCATGDGNTMDLGVPFAPKENFLSNFLRLLGSPPMDAEVYFLEPVRRRRGPPPHGRQSRERIVHALGYGD